MLDQELLDRVAFNIKVERTIKRLTQAKLAELIEVHEKYIGVIEAGKQNITLKTLNKIANALGVDIVKLFEVRE